VLDGASGAQVTKHQLREAAETSAAVYGPELIYGSRSGQLVWHTYSVGQSARAYQISSRITVPPQVHQNSVVVVGDGGQVAVLNAASATMNWSAKLLDGIVAPPAVGNNIVYIASLDQHLWAYDLRNGRRLWRYLTESPLREPPFLLDKQLYQTIPTEGMVCFDAVVKDSPGGKAIWKNPSVTTGHGIGEHKGILWVWDPQTTHMTLLSAARGHSTGATDLPRVKHLELTAPSDGELYAASNDGQIIRLDPRN
jgi:outer membrane protein assembly factor BamB